MFYEFFISSVRATFLANSLALIIITTLGDKEKLQLHIMCVQEAP
jgi:hypothetical protein